MTTITDKLAEAPMSARNLIELCRDALAEELGAWDIDPPLHHVKEAHDACVVWLASQQAEPSEAMVEAGKAAALASMQEAGIYMSNSWLTEMIGAVLQAADAVSAGAPDGYVLVPEKATPLIREALRIGMRREVPNDELCDIRWRAAIAAAQGSVKEAGNG